MKKLFVLFFAVAVTIYMSCGGGTSDAPKGDGTPAKIEFSEEEYDFKTINEGEVVAHTYKFKNVGGTDLIISSINASCGCTAAKWDNKPVAPGAESQVEVEFDSKGRQGSQYKTVTITANTEQRRHELKITGWVKIKDEKAK